MPELCSTDAKDAIKSNEREVTDPVTHLPLTIHDTDAVELEQIPPPPTWSEARKQAENRGENTTEESNERHHDIEAVVREVLSGSWWEDPIGDQRRTDLRTSMVAAGAAAVGALGALISWSVICRLFGGWLGFLLSPIICCALGLLVGYIALRSSPLHDLSQHPNTVGQGHVAADDTVSDFNVYIFFLSHSPF